MNSYRIAVIQGDGIGNEVGSSGHPCARGRGRAQPRGSLPGSIFPGGPTYYFKHRPDDAGADALDVLRPFDANFFGAVGDPRLQDNVTLNGLLLPIRRAFDQYSLRAAGGALSRCAVARLPASGVQGEIDFVVVRENTEGEYAPIGGGCMPGCPNEIAMQSAMFTRHGRERIIRAAFAGAARGQDVAS